MKKTLIPVVLTLFISHPSAAIDLEKPPEFKRSAEELERVQKQKENQRDVEQQQIEKNPQAAELLFPDGHDPRDHDHDHDDVEDLDHVHDDPDAHQKQLELLKEKGIEEKSSWWPF
jgi:hypothetical protein